MDFKEDQLHQPLLVNLPKVQAAPGPEKLTSISNCTWAPSEYFQPQQLPILPQHLKYLGPATVSEDLASGLIPFTWPQLWALLPRVLWIP